MDNKSYIYVQASKQTYNIKAKFKDRETSQQAIICAEKSWEVQDVCSIAANQLIGLLCAILIYQGVHCCTQF